MLKLIFGVGTLAGVSVIFLGACVTSPSKKASVQELAAESPVKNFEVVVCSAKLCGLGTSIVSLNPISEDLLALGADDAQALSLDESQAVSEISEGEAEDNFDQAAAASAVLGRLLFENNISTVVDTTLTGLFFSLSEALAPGAVGAKIPTSNIVAKDAAGKAKIMSIIAAKMEGSKLVAASLVDPKNRKRAQWSEALSAIRDLSGDDGWLNLGDLPRLLPVIANVVSNPAVHDGATLKVGLKGGNTKGDGLVEDESADQVMGYSEAVVEWSKKNVEGSYQWVLTSDNRLGRQVSAQFVRGLELTYGKHWTDLHAESNQFQKNYRSLMVKMGSTSFNLNVRKKLKFYDTGALIEEVQINHLAKALCGKNLRELAKAVLHQEAVICAKPLNAEATVADNIVLPDGLPVAEVEQLISDLTEKKDTQFPPGIIFSLSSSSKLVISKKIGKEPIQK